MNLLNRVINFPIFEKASILYTMIIWCSFVGMLIPQIGNLIIPIIIVAILFLKYPVQLLRNPAFQWGCIYLFMLLLVMMIHPVVGFGYGQGKMDTWMVEAGFILPSLSIGAILLTKRDSLAPKYIYWAFIISIFISLIYIVPTLIFDRNAARSIAIHGGEMVDNQLVDHRAGFWDYTMFHIIALYFIILWGLKYYSIGKMRICATIGAIVVLFIVIQISITTTFIYLFVLIGFLVYKRFEKYRVLGLLITAIIAFTVLFNIDSILLWLLDVYTGSDMESKIRDAIDLLNGGTGRHATIDGRADYQQDNIDAFFQSPIFGGEYSGGGHSVIWVRFGTGGLLCGIPFVMMLISLFRQWYYVIPQCSKLYFLLSWAGAALLLYNKGVFGNSGYASVSFIIPSIAIMYNSKIIKS